MKQMISIRGMSCMHCVKRVKNALLEVEGVTSVDVNLELAKATVDYDESKTTKTQLHQAIEEAGYSVII
jgi:copper ion binding protein